MTLQSLLDSALSCFNNYFLDNILVLQIFDSPTKAKELKAAAPLYSYNSDLDTDLALNVFPGCQRGLKLLHLHFGRATF